MPEFLAKVVLLARFHHHQAIVIMVKTINGFNKLTLWHARNRQELDTERERYKAKVGVSNDFASEISASRHITKCVQRQTSAIVSVGVAKNTPDILF